MEDYKLQKLKNTILENRDLSRSRMESASRIISS
jgi:hypothetical protein